MPTNYMLPKFIEKRLRCIYAVLMQLLYFIHKVQTIYASYYLTGMKHIFLYIPALICVLKFTGRILLLLIMIKTIVFSLDFKIGPLETSCLSDLKSVQLVLSFQVNTIFSVA